MTILWDRHSTEAQWLLSLLHEMVHIWFFYIKKKSSPKCQGEKFQKIIFRAMVRMGWGLL